MPTPASTELMASYLPVVMVNPAAPVCTGRDSTRRYSSCAGLRKRSPDRHNQPALRLVDGRLRHGNELAAGTPPRLDDSARIHDPQHPDDTTSRDEHRADDDDLVERVHRLLVRGERIAHQRLRHDDAHHGHANQRRHACDCVVYRGRDPRIPLVRSASAPKRRDRKNITIVTGSVASPLSSAL